MKKLLILLLIPFLAFITDKSYPVTLPAAKWQQHVNGLNYIQQTIDNSTLPANQVKFIRDSILGPLQNDIIGQVRPQLLKDTTGKK